MITSAMKRDMDLIRAMMLSIEDSPSGLAPEKIEVSTDYTQDEIYYHTLLLGDSGFAQIREDMPISSRTPHARIMRLTWAGHEFLDAARENQTWNQAKDAIGKVGGATIQIWVAVLTSIIQKKLGL